jgi:hypothetical protein
MEQLHLSTEASKKNKLQIFGVSNLFLYIIYIKTLLNLLEIASDFHKSSMPGNFQIQKEYAGAFVIYFYIIFYISCFSGALVFSRKHKHYMHTRPCCFTYIHALAEAGIHKHLLPYKFSGFCTVSLASQIFA